MGTVNYLYLCSVCNCLHRSPCSNQTELQPLNIFSKPLDHAVLQCNNDIRLMSSLLSYLDTGFVINGRYRIERRIGAGGFAIVFEAFDLQIDRRVAIKVLHIGNLYC